MPQLPKHTHTHITKKHEIAPLTLSHQELHFPTLGFGDIEPLVTRKGYHFKAKILPKRVLTLGASATRIHKNLLEYPLIPKVIKKFHANLLKANLFYRRYRLQLCAEHMPQLPKHTHAHMKKT